MFLFKFLKRKEKKAESERQHRLEHSAESIRDGVVFYVKYIGSTLIETDTIPRKAILNCCKIMSHQSNQLNTKEKADKKVLGASVPGDTSSTQFSHKMKVSVDGISLTAINTGRMLANDDFHKIVDVALADTGCIDDVVGYVTGDEINGRACHVVVCDSSSVYSTITKARTLFLKEAQQTESNVTDQPDTGTTENVSEEQSQRDVRMLWSEQPEVVESGILTTLDPQEREKQEALFEVISTEKSYLKNLRDLDSFIKSDAPTPGNPQCIVDKPQFDILFSNVAKIIETSQRFLDALGTELNASSPLLSAVRICDVISEFASEHFDAYVKYGWQNLREQGRLLEVLGERNPFLMELQAHLFRPMQRIARLPFLVDAIRSQYDQESEEFISADKALEASKKVTEKYNEEICKMEEQKKMANLCQRIEFKVKSIPLQSSHRQLLHRGKIQSCELAYTKRRSILSSKKKYADIQIVSVYFMIFDDLLLITKQTAKNGEAYYCVLDYAYKGDIKVERRGDSCHTLSLTLAKNCDGETKRFLLYAENEDDKEQWVEALNGLHAEDEQERPQDTSTAENASGEQSQRDVGTLWSQQPEVMKSGILTTLAPQERKKQEALFEVIRTEETYLKDLQELDSFIKSDAQRPGNPFENLFSYVSEIINISQSFLDALGTELNASSPLLSAVHICDVISEFSSKHFDVYIRYCKLRESPRFLDGLGERDDFLKDLRSLLVRPMQRMTRLPLLVKAIQSPCVPESEEFISADKALKASKKVAETCNEEVRKIERWEEMLKLCQRIDFKDKKRIPLQSSCRQLLLCDKFKIKDDNKIPKAFVMMDSVYLILFDDWLLITKQTVENSEDHYCVLDYVQKANIKVKRRGSKILSLTLVQNCDDKTKTFLLYAEKENTKEQWFMALNGPKAEEERRAQEKDALQKEKWFHGKMARDKAELLLDNEGDYLVRESERRQGAYVLSGVTEHTKQKAHVLLCTDPRGKLLVEGKEYQSISLFISSSLFEKISISIPRTKDKLFLRNPVIRGDADSEVMYVRLCRSQYP